MTQQNVDIGKIMFDKVCQDKGNICKGGLIWIRNLRK